MAKTYKNNIAEENGKFYIKFNVHGIQVQKLVQGAKTRAEAKIILESEKLKIIKKENGLIKDIKPVPLKAIVKLYKDYNAENNRQREPKEKVKALYEYFGAEKDARKIAQSNVRAWRKWLKTVKNLSNSTINRYVSFLSKCYKLAMVECKQGEGLLDFNPCTGIGLLEEPKECIKYYNKDEEQKIIKTATIMLPAFKSFIVGVFQTGLRISNIQFMKWEWIDISARIIQIQPQDNKGSKLIRLYITDELLKELTSMGIKESGYVFLNPESNNTWINPTRFLKRICKKAKVKYIGFHGIRHSVCTDLVEKGVPLNVVKEIMAHSDIRTTMKYTHLKDESIKNAMQLLNRY